MSPTSYRGDIIPQDTADDDSSFGTATSQPLTGDEIQDVLYGEGRSTEDRLALLRQLRGDIADGEGYDVGDNDALALIAEIDERIGELESGDERNGTVFATDELAHRETLSPDSDELEALEEEDEASLDEEDDWLDEEDSDDKATR